MSIPATKRVSRTWERARRPNREHVEKLKARVPYWFVAVIMFLFALLQIGLNPFGFSDLTQRYTQDVANLLITGPYLYPTTGRQQITVALVDEPTLQHLQMPWPWNYGAHARALDAILAYQPKAVVVDFLFVDSRADPTLSDLVDEIARYKKAGVPLYFEGGTELPFGEAPLLPELARTGVRILDPSIEIYDGVVRQYPASGRCFGPSGMRDGKCLSLALQVYKDLHPERRFEPLKGKLELVWGTNTSPFNVKFNDEHNYLPCNNETGFLLRIYRAFFDKKTAVGRCPYTNDVPVEALLAGGADEDLNLLIPNHVIFYGGSLEGAQDTSFSPVNGQQANVFVHAMALDNLISFDGRPEQNVMSLGSITLSHEPAQVMAIIPLIAILSYVHLWRIRSHRKVVNSKDHGALYDWLFDKGIEHLWQWLAFFLALGIGLVLARLVGLSVANWAEDVFLSVELVAMLLLGIPDSLWGYLHHVAGTDNFLPETTA